MALDLFTKHEAYASRFRQWAFSQIRKIADDILKLYLDPPDDVMNALQLLALCEVTSKFPSQRALIWRFNVFSVISVNKLKKTIAWPQI